MGSFWIYHKRDSSTDSIGAEEFLNGFVSSLVMVAVSGLGDKTFFIVAILSMRYSRLSVLAGALSALGIMTLVSAGAGQFLSRVPARLVQWLSAGMFFLCGVYMLWNASRPEVPHRSSLQVVELEVEERLERRRSALLERLSDPKPHPRWRRWLDGALHSGAGETFLLVGAGECGDRTQLATMVLAGREGFWPVLCGSLLGQALCTLPPVFGGQWVASVVPVRVILLIGGLVFLLFAVLALFFEPTAHKST